MIFYAAISSHGHATGPYIRETINRFESACASSDRSSCSATSSLQRSSDEQSSTHRDTRAIAHGAPTAATRLTLQRNQRRTIRRNRRLAKRNTIIRCHARAMQERLDILEGFVARCAEQRVDVSLDTSNQLLVHVVTKTGRHMTFDIKLDDDDRDADRTPTPTKKSYSGHGSTDWATYDRPTRIRGLPRTARQRTPPVSICNINPRSNSNERTNRHRSSQRTRNSQRDGHGQPRLHRAHARRHRQRHDDRPARDPRPSAARERGQRHRRRERRVRRGHRTRSRRHPRRHQRLRAEQPGAERSQPRGHRRRDHLQPGAVRQHRHRHQQAAGHARIHRITRAEHGRQGPGEEALRRPWKSRSKKRPRRSSSSTRSATISSKRSCTT